MHSLDFSKRPRYNVCIYVCKTLIIHISGPIRVKCVMRQEKIIKKIIKKSSNLIECTVRYNEHMRYSSCMIPTEN